MAKKILLIVWFVFCLGACSDSPEENRTPLKIGIDVFPGWGHAYIAQQKGFFEKNGVNVELIHKQNYLDIIDDYANGILDGAFMVFADAIYFHDQGINTKVPYISDHSIKGDVLYAVPEVQNVKDLIGKTIGVEGINSFSHLFVLSALEQSGLKEGDVYFKSINAQELIQEIEQGNIIAGHTYGPAREQAETKGLTPLAYSGDVKGIITDVLAIQTNLSKRRPEDVKALVASLYEAKAFQTNNPQEAHQIIANANGDTLESVSWGTQAVEYLTQADTLQAMHNDPPGELFTYGQKISEFYFNRGQISQIPDLEEIIDSSFLTSAQ